MHLTVVADLKHELNKQYMTRKEHLLKLIPDIEYDLRLKKLNLILEAMENHTEEQLQSDAVSHRKELLAFKQFISGTPQTELEYYSDEEFTDLYIKAKCT